MARPKALNVILGALLSLVSILSFSEPTEAKTGTLFVSPSSGPPGTSVTVNGSNFSPGQTFTVKFESVAMETGIVSIAGDISATFVIPEVERGQYRVTITTPAPDTSSPDYFTVTPLINIATTSGKCGDEIAAVGIGFDANSTVTFYLDGENAGTANSDSSGSFSDGIITIPAAPFGHHLLTAGDSGGQTPSVVFAISQSLGITPVVGSVGEKLTIFGFGFTANSLVEVMLDGESLVNAAASTDEKGQFINDAFTIIPSSSGKHTIMAKDGAGNNASSDFMITPRLTITPESGTPGTSIHFAGDGFQPGRTVVLKYNDLDMSTVPSVINSSDKGSFKGTITIPGGLPGPYPIAVTDGINSATVSFEATLEASISQITTAQTPGYVGMNLVIEGAGFKPGAEISICCDASPSVPLATTNADEQGSFQSSFTIPPTKAGSHVLTASDGINTNEFSFVMEAVPPIIPVILVPEIGKKSSRPVHFDWKDVSDVSGVSYVLQVASDDDFENVVLEKIGLTASEYVLTKEESLKSVLKATPYFLRIKAVDNAGNESVWSKEVPFYLGFVLTLPNGDSEITLPAIFVYICSLTVIATITAAFLIGRRTTRRRVFLREVVATESLQDGLPPKLLE